MKQKYSFQLADFILIGAIILALIVFAPSIGNAFDYLMESLR